MRPTTRYLAALAFGMTLTAACDQSTPVAPRSPSSGDELALARAGTRTLDPALCALSRRDFTLRSTNPYFPLTAGSRWVLRGKENGTRVELRATVLDETEKVGRVTTRVIEERHFEDGELVELSRNFFAATREGTVCYLGEEVDIYEDGEIVSHAGAWRADAPGNAPGIFIPADPQVGMKYAMENAPGVAQDAAEIVRKDFRVVVPAGAFKRTLGIRETNPLDGDVGFKVFARGVGLVVDETLKLVRYRIARDDDRDSDE